MGNQLVKTRGVPLHKVAVIEVLAEWIARGLGGSMPVNNVFFKRVVGSEIEAATKPPHRVRSLLLSNEEAHVGM